MRLCRSICGRMRQLVPLRGCERVPWAYAGNIMQSMQPDLLGGALVQVTRTMIHAATTLAIVLYFLSPSGHVADEALLLRSGRSQMPRHEGQVLSVVTWRAAADFQKNNLWRRFCFVQLCVVVT